VGGVELPSYFGDIINRAQFTAEARRPDPNLILDAYYHAALTLNFIRSLSAGGFADAHHPEYWDLSFFQRTAVPEALRTGYEQTTAKVGEALRFMSALGERTIAELTRVEFFTSHDGLLLEYESALTQRLPRREGYYDLSAHFPWIGERTRQVDGAHVEFFRGVRNPVGVKLGPSVSPDEVLALLKALNPDNEPGKLALITRMGANRVTTHLPPIVEAVKAGGHRVLWIVDPMHGNTRPLASGHKTRLFSDIISEVEQSFQVLRDDGGRRHRMPRWGRVCDHGSGSAPKLCDRVRPPPQLPPIAGDGPSHRPLFEGGTSANWETLMESFNLRRREKIAYPSRPTGA
jgi:3-deoxy-7-phosphoheptulonate synthase